MLDNRKENQSLLLKILIEIKGVAYDNFFIKEMVMSRKSILMVGESYHNSNLFYKTRFFSATPFVYLEHKEMSYIITSSANWEEAKNDARVTTVYPFSYFNYVKQIKKTGHKDLAFLLMLKEILDHFHVDEVTIPKDFPVFFGNGLTKMGIKIHIDCDLLNKERSIKSDEEILAIKETQMALEDAMYRAEDMIRKSEIKNSLLFYKGEKLTTSKIKRTIEIALLENDCNLFDLIVACGKNSADPHYPGDSDIHCDEPIMIDIFPFHKRSRYFADMTRTFVKGEGTKELHKMYQSVLKAQERALSSIKAGLYGSIIYQTACDSFNEDGFITLREQKPTEPLITKGFVHSIGHGVGLDVHETPFLFSQEIELLERNVITIEPGLYDPDIGGIRLEDLVVVTKDSHEPITKYHKDFIIP